MQELNTDRKVEHSLKVLVSQLHANPWNPNRMNERQSEALSESLEQFGQVAPIVVRPHPDMDNQYQIIDGEHRFKKFDEFVYVNVLHGLSDGEAKKLTIILNETHGQSDRSDLAALLVEISNDLDGDLDMLKLGLPYLDDELPGLLSVGEFDWDGEAEDDGEDEARDGSTEEIDTDFELEHTCPKCGFEFDAKK